MKVNDNRVKKSCSLLACLRHAMRIVRWSGYFPVHGLYQLTADGTKFKAKSFYGIYNVFTLTGQVIMLCFSVHFFFNNEVTVLSASNVMMYLTNLLMAISLVRLAKCWPALMKAAEETERSLTILELDNNTIKKSNVFAYGIAIISLGTQLLSTISWSELREHYSKLALLVKEIDTQLSGFVLLSFFCDMYYTCAQLFILLRILATPDFILSYYTSFVFVITRFVLLSLFGANVHNTAQKPIIPVYSVQPEEYDQEVLRFQLILRYTTVAFSGKFFYVTRNTILQVISTIVTYELVLLQFSKTYTEDDVANNTTTTTF
ncbi:unnamed protein product [Arctia plantaginis]|uniref:Gustatory receptor n=1 Tax=Arctia plantaginis TaxID=874455 RepID=A0A8S0YNX1_ARCPL|nr:unnamed protein product [Arctia plantaginis]